MTLQRTTDKPSAPQVNQCLLSHFLASWEPKRKLIAHRCCDQLTAVKTGYPLTSIIIELEYLSEVIRWQVTSFQMIAGSCLIFFKIHMKYVVFYMCRTIKILISNWPRKLKFSQFLQAGKTCQLLLTFLTKVTRWSRSTSKFLCSDWSKFDRWVHAENLCSVLKLVYFDSWSWQSFVSTCDVF